jgi:hypothetical protein
MEPTPPITAEKVAVLHKRIIQIWHEQEEKVHSWPDAFQVCGVSKGEPDRLIYDLALINTFQWHEEDKARMVGVTDRFLGEVKRSIDASNQRRTDKIEELDFWLVRWLQEANIQPNSEVSINSETPGSLIDRLSILRLKIYHMYQETLRDNPEHLEKCRAKLGVLYEQERDLDCCFDELLSDLLRAKKRLKIYFQFKMYNDPDTNPAIYSNKRPV